MTYMESITLVDVITILFDLFGCNFCKCNIILLLLLRIFV